LSICEIGFAGALLSNEGFSFDLDEVEFREGLDSGANWFTSNAYNKPNTWAVTQFSTIYVKPTRWDEVTDPRDTTFWEEIGHTAQFSTWGSRFYVIYGQGIAESFASGGNGYEGNPVEEQAKAWADTLAGQYNANPCAG
jgi:hypothetical protein